MQVIRIGNKSLYLLSHLLALVGAFSLHFFITDGVDYYFVCFWLGGIFVFVLYRIISCSLLFPFYIGNLKKLNLIFKKASTWCLF